MKESYISRSKYTEFAVKLYNRISGSSVIEIEEIPKESLSFILNMTYKELIIPFVKEDCIKGMGPGALKRKYGIEKDRFFRKIRESLGITKNSRPKKSIHPTFM